MPIADTAYIKADGSEGFNNYLMFSRDQRGQISLFEIFSEEEVKLLEKFKIGEKID